MRASLVCFLCWSVLLLNGFLKLLTHSLSLLLPYKDRASKVLAFVSADQTHLLAFARLVALDEMQSVLLDVFGPMELQKKLLQELLQGMSKGSKLLCSAKVLGDCGLASGAADAKMKWL